MKKTTILFVMTLVLVSSLNAQVNFGADVPETIDTEIWNGVGWDKLFFTTYTFNADCLVIEALAEQLNTSTNTYENLRRDTQTYDVMNFPSVASVELWNSITEEWEIDEQTITTINNNLTESTLTQKWNSITMSWDNVSREDYTYNTNDQLLTVTTLDWNSFTNSFENESRQTFSYFPNGLREQLLEEDYNLVTLSWENTFRTSYSYNTNDKISELLGEDWSGSEWEPSTLNNFTYDSNGFITELLLSEWNNASMVYDESQRSLYTNNTEGQALVIVLQVNISGIWFNTSRNIQTFPICSTLSIVDDEELNYLELFPNPFDSNINIRGLGSNELINTEVFDLTGKRVFQSSQDLKELSLEHLKAGIYILSLQTETEKATFKIVKQ